MNCLAEAEPAGACLVGSECHCVNSEGIQCNPYFITVFFKPGSVSEMLTELGENNLRL